jgi:multidrug resistance efflux pump
MQAMQQGLTPQVPEIRDQATVELIEKAQTLSYGFEFLQTVIRCADLEEVYLLLTNDIRCLMEFDRSFLITHLGGSSRFVAAGATIAPEKKSQFYQKLNRLGPSLPGLTKPVLISKDYAGNLTEYGISEELQSALRSFIEFSGCNYFFCQPLQCSGSVIGHLIFEFCDDCVPDRNGLLVMNKVEPFLATALAQKWLEHTRPTVGTLIRPPAEVTRGRAKSVLRKLRVIVPAALILGVVLFLIPFDHTVGGEAEIVPGVRNLAFCRMEGLIDRVFVQEGSEVEKGMVMATLDPKDLEFKIKMAERELDIMTQEMRVLSDGAGRNPSKLAQAQLVELNREKKLKELEYLKSRREFLNITAPASGVITTKHVQTLSGKRFMGGDAFCEIAGRSDLSVDVCVPDDRVTLVKPGQPVSIYLNSSPSHEYTLTLKEIAPRAEATQRFGNIFRANAKFTGAPPFTMVGMKGIGKIHTGTESLWSIIAQRVKTRWNEFSASIM